MRSAATVSFCIDVELPVDDHAMDIRLKLKELIGLGQFIVTAVRATGRQRNITGFVTHLGHRSAMIAC